MTLIIPRRQAVAWAIVAPVIGLELFKSLARLPELRPWVLPYITVLFGLMAGLPFALRRAFPTVAEFDSRWTPTGWSPWLWFPGMVLLLIAASLTGGWVQSFRNDWEISRLLRLDLLTDSAPATIVFRGIVSMLLAPIAEEIFWRGYVLTQLGKLAHWSIALLIQALLFAFVHLPSPGAFVTAFLIGTINGSWRTRFRGLLPLVLAHIIVNTVALFPQLSEQYDVALRRYPKCRAIDLLKDEPDEKALPAIVAYLGDSDDVVSAHALEVLDKNYRGKAEPYLRDALVSSDHRVVDRALFAIGWLGYSGLNPQVRTIAWSADAASIQLAATQTLFVLGDKEALTGIAQRHPDETVRRAAKKLLALIQKNESLSQ